MVEIIWTDPALSDLHAIADYIALDNPEAAARLVRRIVSHIELLSKHPELGPRMPELLPGSRYRQLVEPPCRVVYRLERQNKKVFILGVMRSEKLFQQRLLLRADWAAEGE